MKRHHGLFAFRSPASIVLGVVLVLAASLATMSLGGRAAAQYKLCNKTSYVLSAAIGYADEGALLTRGWWRLRAGQCKDVLTEPVTAGRYFVYAEAIPGHTGELRTWSGRTPLCVQSDSIFTLRDQDVCVDDPRRQREFFPVDVDEGRDGMYTTEFVDEPNYATYSAEVAGVQRLLTDVGIFTGKIDGELGDGTRRAIRAYQRTKGMSQSGVIDDTMVDVLIEDANNVQDQMGFIMCNDTSLPVWAAFAQPLGGEGDYRSAGWWRLEGNKCAKVRRGSLSAGSYYVYGVMEAENRSMPLVGGDKEFCVSSVQFEAEGDVVCEESGYDRAGFRRIDVGNTKSATFRFTAGLFNSNLAER